MTAVEDAVASTPPATRQDEARQALWVQHYPSLAGWLASLVGDVDVAHDLAAEAFTRLLGRWRAVKDPRTYLFTIGANLARDHWRQQAQQRRLTERVGQVTPTSSPGPDPWLLDLVERLPERTRMPVLLHYYADLPVAAVAAALRKPEGTVKRALSDGRAALLATIRMET